jgi:tripartite-type tricarboxylate transporter receptor subunit TctC
MRLLRKFFLFVLAAFSVLAQAQQPGIYPNKPIKMIIPFPPGGGNDSLGRLVAQRLGESLAATVVIENRGGAGATIGTDMAAKSQPDGYTILLSSITTHALAPHLYAKLPYDPLKDFVPLIAFASAPTVIVVGPSVKARSLQALIATAKAAPGKLTFASGGNGAAPHIAAEVFKSLSQTDMLHIPFKGGGPAAMAVMAGDVDVIFDTAASAMPHIKSGKLTALAVSTPTRMPDQPDLQTFAEQGMPGFEFNSWYSLHAPAGTPQPIVNRLREALGAIMRTPDMRERIKSFGADPIAIIGDDFAAFQLSEFNKYGGLIKQAGIKLD